jgi:hypothetical protein
MTVDVRKMAADTVPEQVDNTDRPQSKQFGKRMWACSRHANRKVLSALYVYHFPHVSQTFQFFFLYNLTHTHTQVRVYVLVSTTFVHL